MDTWAGKAAVITGGASGIGFALAQNLAQRGVRLLLANIEQAALDSALANLRAAGALVEGRRTDVADRAQMEELAGFCQATFGDVHLLFNNAGVLVMGPTWELSADDWRWVWGVNVYGVVNGIHRSWRNRPEADTPWSPRDQDPERIAMAEAYRTRGKMPEEIAATILRGMEEERFYIFTEDNAGSFVRMALQPAIEARNPPVTTWGVDLRAPEEREGTW